MPEFTENEVKTIDALVAAVKENGTDYVYPGAEAGECNYLEYDEPTGTIPTGPSCIVGYAILGAELIDMPTLALQENEQPTAFEMALLLRKAGVCDTVGRALTVAQTTQDGGETWGHALSEALRTLRGAGYDTSRWES